MSDPIVAGVGGTRGSRRAVLWAADEAARRHAQLRLVHAFGIPDAFYGETLPARDWLDVRRGESQTPLSAAVEDARRVHPALDISSESSVDAPIRLLIQRSEHATMLVLGASERTALGDLLVSSTAAALAAHAQCPFVVVRGRDHSGPGIDAPVVVGVDGSPANEPAIGLAFEEASLRGAPLVAVHAWSDADSSQVFGAARAAFDFEPLRESETRVLAEAMAGWQEKYPDVTVRRVLERDRPRPPAARLEHPRATDRRGHPRPWRVHRADPRLRELRPDPPRLLPGAHHPHPLTLRPKDPRSGDTVPYPARRGPTEAGK